MRRMYSAAAAVRSWSAAWSSALLTGSRVVSALAVNKIIATYLGPSGLALVGQFQNFTAIVFGLTSGNVSNAVITTVSGARDDNGRRRVISTAFAVSAMATGLMALVIGLQADRIASHVLGDVSLAPVLIGLSLLMIPLILNVVLLGVAAGLGRVRAFVTINIGVTFVSVPVCLIMVLSHGIVGALLSAVIVNAAALLATGAWLLRSSPFPIAWLWSGIDPAAMNRLLRLAAMTISTAIAVPAAQFLVRYQILNDYGADSAGQWQAALKTGEVLLMGASVMVSLHFLPRFSAAGGNLRRSALHASAKMVLGLAVVAVATVACSGLLLPLLFSKDFSTAADLLPIQVAGDVLRGGVIVLQAAFMAGASTSSYIAVDLVYACVMAGVGLLLVPHYGSSGAVIAVLMASVCALGAAVLLMEIKARGDCK